MASSNVPRHIVLTGPPGIGKTTLIRKACEQLQSHKISIQGFYTEELRNNGKRTGFDIVTLDGQRGPLARIKEQESYLGASRREYVVGQYSVRLQEFESIALSSLKRTGTSPVIVVDEIGKMELFSHSFIKAVQSLLDNAMVFCTIPIPKGKPLALVEHIRKRNDAIIYEINRQNRDTILDNIVQSVKDSYSTYNESNTQ